MSSLTGGVDDGGGLEILRLSSHLVLSYLLSYFPVRVLGLYLSLQHDMGNRDVDKKAKSTERKAFKWHTFVHGCLLAFRATRDVFGGSERAKLSAWSTQCLNSSSFR